MNDYAVFENGNIATIEKAGKDKFDISVTSIRGGTSFANFSGAKLREFIDAINQVLDSDTIDTCVELAEKNMKDKTKGRKKLGI